MRHLPTLSLPLLLVTFTATPVRADEPPGPGQVRRNHRPPSGEPDKPVAAPVTPEESDPLAPAKTEPAAPAKAEPAAPVKAPVAPPADAKDAKKEATGCRVDAAAGAWPLLALAGLGLRRRRIS